MGAPDTKRVTLVIRALENEITNVLVRRTKMFAPSKVALPKALIM